VGGPDASERARQAIACLDGNLAGLYDDVRLLITELVTNCVRHGGVDHDAVFEIELATWPRGVRVEVTDWGPGFSAPESFDTQSGHFGLFLVDEVADRWGVERLGQGSRVWFEIDR
jgi:anti-sigma regulatory factor (Ser/Thr protein kinase)